MDVNKDPPPSSFKSDTDLEEVDEEDQRYPSPESKTRPTLKTVLSAKLSLDAYVVEPDSSLTPCDIEDVKRTFKKKTNDDDAGSPPKKHFWVDAEIRSKAQFEEIKCFVDEKLGLNKFMKRQFNLHQMEIPQVLILRKTALIVFRVLPMNEATNGARYSCAIVVDGLLLTMSMMYQGSVQRELVSKSRKKSSRFLQQDIAFSMKERDLPEASVSGVLLAWIGLHLSHTSSQVALLRKNLYIVAGMMEEDASTVRFEDLTEHKDNILKLLAVVEEQREGVESLIQGDQTTSAIDFNGLNGSTRVLVSTAEATERMILRMEKRIGHMRQTYESIQQERINKRLAVLTVLSAVFLPLTLMAGIWGMNFQNMPELQRENSYYIALASMAIVGLSLMFTFHHCGWFE